MVLLCHEPAAAQDQMRLLACKPATERVASFLLRQGENLRSDSIQLRGNGSRLRVISA